MNVSRFRRDRRQRNPFAAGPPVPAGRNAHGWPLVRDAIGVRPATGGEMAAPHGIATPQTLTDIVAQAQAETAAAREQAPAAPWGPWDQPGSFPAAMHAEALSDEHGRWYGWDTTVLDNPPVHTRPYIPGVLGDEGRLSPRTAGISEDLGALPLFRDSVRRMTRPCCDRCRQASGTWQERLYGTFRHHTWEVPEAAPRQFGIATELRQAHGETAAAADRSEQAFAGRYLRRAA